MVDCERNFWKYVGLGILTCGIYDVYFVFKMVNDINKMCDGDGKTNISAIMVLVLTIVTCGLFMFYWMYTTEERLIEKGKTFGLTIKESGLEVLLWQLAGSLTCGITSFYAIYLIIKNSNLVGEAYNFNCTHILS